MRKVFAITKNVQRFMAGVEAVNTPIRGRIGMLLVYGEPGTGKTEMAQKYAVDNDFPYIRAKDITSRRSLLSDIVAELGEAPAYRSDDLFNQAVEQLLEQPRTLIVDEVDYLVRGGMIESLRDLNDITNCPIIMLGMHKVDTKLKRFRHLFDRFSAVVHFRTFDTDDIRMLAEQICEVPITDAGIKFIHDRGYGKFRRTMVWFSRAERLARNNGLDVVDVEHLKSAKGGAA